MFKEKTIEELEELSPQELGWYLYYSARHSTSDHYIKVLLGYGADLGARDTMGSTSLHYAARYGDVKIVKLLLQSGASKDVQDNRGKTAWDLAERDVKEKIPELNPNA